MKFWSTLVLVTAICFVLSANGVYAETSPDRPAAATQRQIELTASQCPGLVKECFQKKGVAQANCFYSSWTHPFCEGAELGKVIQKRWSLSTDVPVSEEALGLMGPALTDRKCVENCDNQWYADILQDKIASPDIEGANSCYTACRRNETDRDLLRP